MPAELLDHEERWLRGESGRAMALAMQLLVAAAEATDADEFVAIEMVHLNSCHYSGQLSLDLAELLLADEVRFAVPTHSNASLVSCGAPSFRPAAESPEAIWGARRVMEIYETLGCSAMWTCAPYQQPEGRPGFGQHVVVSESNAVGFTNSVLGARTNKYGDVLDVAAALVGRVPLAGLHTDEGRRGTHLFDVTGLPDAVVRDPTTPHLLGALIGRTVADGVPVIVGLTTADEDDLKAIAAAAAATGGVGLFHVVGITPEAPTMDAATGGRAPSRVTDVATGDLEDAASLLRTASGDEPLRAVCVGTPHFSATECRDTLALLDDRRVDPSITFVLTTSRAVATELQLGGTLQALDAAGVQVVLDTCSYYPPRPSGVDGLTLTNSAKWAYYAPGLLGVPVAFASLERCVDSAVAGEWRP